MVLIMRLPHEGTHLTLRDITLRSTSTRLSQPYFYHMSIVVTATGFAMNFLNLGLHGQPAPGHRTLIRGRRGRGEGAGTGEATLALIIAFVESTMKGMPCHCLASTVWGCFWLKVGEGAGRSRASWCYLTYNCHRQQILSSCSAKPIHQCSRPDLS